jgi:hypothetical protein
VIGVFSSPTAAGAATVGVWATAGGTAPAIVLDPTMDFTQRLLSALNQIRGAALACEFAIPPPQMGTLDYGKVNVRASAGGAPEDLLYVGRADRCDPARGGWYYDVDPAMGKPARVLLCPATCTRVKADPAARVDLLFGCATRFIP